MKSRFFYTGAALGLFLFFIAGCATTGPKEEQVSAQDPCADTLTRLVEEARQTMHSTEAICNELRMEATPMWSMDYDGTVHVRVHDIEGNSVLDEMRTPRK